MGGSLPHSLYTAEQTRRLDAEAIKKHGIPGFELMKRAGQVAFEAALNTWPHVGRGGCMQVLCGAGNNGGDGYIVAALARHRYIPVRVIALRDPEQLTGDARKAWEWYKSLGGRWDLWSAQVELGADLLVDAMLGTGLSGDVRGDYAAAIRTVNASGKPVLAVDIPSGLSADTGKELGQAVQADLTVTFIGAKRGLFTGAGAKCCGEICFSDLNVPSEIYETEQPSAELLNRAQLASLVFPRDRDAHKGRHGHLLVIGGDYGMGGAAIMAAEAGLFCGVGLVTMVSRPEHAMACMVRRPEIMVRGVDSNAKLKPLLKGKTAIVVGPGLGCNEWGLGLLKQALSSDLPVLLDADALNMVAEAPELFKPREHCVITPHPGETGRLLGQTVADVSSDRFVAVEKLQALCGGTAVLKGSGSLVASVDSNQKCCIHVCEAGNPGMAVAGMGDVLSGIIGAFLAQGLTAANAARLGVWLHASAGDLCAKTHGEAGLTATELIPAARKLLNGLMAENT